MLKSLEGNTKYQQYSGRDAALLERFSNPAVPGKSLRVAIEAPEFTCLCPITGQPDFATIQIEYEPVEWCVESKSLKLYLMSFRNEGVFHEACVVEIGTALRALLEPKSLRVVGQFAPRGGISFHPVFEIP